MPMLLVGAMTSPHHLSWLLLLSSESSSHFRVRGTSEVTSSNPLILQVRKVRLRAKTRLRQCSHALGRVRIRTQDTWLWASGLFTLCNCIVISGWYLGLAAAPEPLRLPHEELHCHRRPSWTERGGAGWVLHPQQ